MRVCYVLEHVVDGAFGRVALAVVAPATRAAARGHRRPAGRPTAEGLVAFRVGTCDHNNECYFELDYLFFDCFLPPCEHSID